MPREKSRKQRKERINVDTLFNNAIKTSDMKNFDADTAELLSIPGLKDRAWTQFTKLKELGCIS